MSKKIKWGIIATGRIAKLFVDGIKQSSNGELYAVCSRDINKAKSFISENGGVKAYDNEEMLASDKDIDIVYIANPHPFHCKSALICLNAGKAVLCEKSVAMNAADTALLVDTARKNKVYFMEAMWARFNPTTQKLCQLINQEAIGKIKMATIHFGFKAKYDKNNIKFNPDLGGGALLDIGIYSLSFCSMILGTPTRIQSTAHIGETKVDEQCAFLLDYPDGSFATATASLVSKTNQDAWIFGTHGRIHLTSPLHCSKQLRLFTTIDNPANDSAMTEKEEIFNFDFKGNGYHFEAEAVANDILAGKLENELMPLAETLSIAKTMNDARNTWGLTYPCEQ